MAELTRRGPRFDPTDGDRTPTEAGAQAARCSLAAGLMLDGIQSHSLFRLARFLPETPQTGSSRRRPGQSPATSGNRWTFVPAGRWSAH